ncbi:MAG: phasin family protein [Methylobacteriaceae bacterium]|nr:phasin family protein [Methylobacteriaceae bacterium]
MFTTMEDFQKLGKDQMDAATKFASTYSKNMQQFALETSDYAKASMEQGAAALEKLMGAKSLDKAIEIQTDYAKQAYEAFVARATKVGELYTAMAKDAYKPFETAVAKATAK